MISGPILDVPNQSLHFNRILERIIHKYTDRETAKHAVFNGLFIHGEAYPSPVASYPLHLNFLTYKM